MRKLTTCAILTFTTLPHLAHAGEQMMACARGKSQSWAQKQPAVTLCLNSQSALIIRTNIDKSSADCARDKYSRFSVSIGTATSGSTFPVLTLLPLEIPRGELSSTAKEVLPKFVVWGAPKLGTQGGQPTSARAAALFGRINDEVIREVLKAGAIRVDGDVRRGNEYLWEFSGFELQKIVR